MGLGFEMKHDHVDRIQSEHLRHGAIDTESLERVVAVFRPCLEIAASSAAISLSCNCVTVTYLPPLIRSRPIISNSSSPKTFGWPHASQV
jgi:hypothetical protein